MADDEEQEMNGLQKSNRLHGKWLILLTVCFAAGFILDWWIRPKKENYRELWRANVRQQTDINDHEQRLKRLEAQ